MTCRVIQHVLFEDLGIFEDVLKKRGHEIIFHQAGVNLPTQEEWLGSDIGIVMGGPIGVGDTAIFPYIEDELSLVTARAKAAKPTLGVCLGAQFLAKALGAEVYPNTEKEIGWSELKLSRVGKASPLRHLEGVPVLHWHGETFDLPPCALPLASTPITKSQAFAMGENILALQFHPEVDAARLEQWLIGHSVELGLAKADVAALRQGAQSHGAALKAAGTLLLEEWLDKLTATS
jgi:GMP synthase (glutamine-hydrolysing)